MVSGTASGAHTVKRRRRSSARARTAINSLPTNDVPARWSVNNATTTFGWAARNVPDELRDEPVRATHGREHAVGALAACGGESWAVRVRGRHHQRKRRGFFRQLVDFRARQREQRLVLDQPVPVWPERRACACQRGERLEAEPFNEAVGGVEGLDAAEVDVDSRHEHGAMAERRKHIAQAGRAIHPRGTALHRLPPPGVRGNRTGALRGHERARRPRGERKPSACRRTAWRTRPTP